MESFSGYAYAQIKRAKGRNKWVNNPKPKTPPDKLDFCWFIPIFSEAIQCVKDCSPPDDIENPGCGFPMRPIAVQESRVDLAECHVAKLEHCENIYRLYEYPSLSFPAGDGRPIVKPRGVFRGENQQLVVESISKEEEFWNFRGLLIFNEQAYARAKKDHKSYWEWVEKRNKARWVTQERGEIDFDSKNMMHCMRLMLSGMSILENGFPIVRFEGAQRDLLMDIRNGRFQYEELMQMMEEYEARLKELGEKSSLPDKADYKKANRLYRQIMKEHG
jgi:hypothetical protein